MMTLVASDDGDYVQVSVAALNRLRDHVMQRAIQNHNFHKDWNEGLGDFAACTRGDCREVLELAREWGWL